MIVDSSALLAILLGEPDQLRYASVIAGAQTRTMSVASYLEVALKIDRIAKFGGDPVLDVALDRLGIDLAAVTVVHGKVARDAFNRYGYDHPAKLNFGDCLVYALAKTRSEPLLFKGNDFARTDLLLVETDPDKEWK